MKWCTDEKPFPYAWASRTIQVAHRLGGEEAKNRDDASTAVMRHRGRCIIIVFTLHISLAVFTHLHTAARGKRASGYEFLERGAYLCAHK